LFWLVSVLLMLFIGVQAPQHSSEQHQQNRGGTLKTECWLRPFLNAAQNPSPSFKYCSLFHIFAPRNPYSVLFTLQQASMPTYLVHSSMLCRKCVTRPALLSLVWWNVNQRECLFQSEAWPCWGFWGLWNREDSQYRKSCSSFHGLWPASKVEATSGLIFQSWNH
jgi:hypothetical protein